MVSRSGEKVGLLLAALESRNGEPAGARVHPHANVPTAREMVLPLKSIPSVVYAKSGFPSHYKQVFENWTGVKRFQVT